MDPISLTAWFREFGTDIGAVLASAALVGAYYLFHAAQVRRDPSYSIHFVNELTRRIWVEHVMGDPSKDVMAVQTLRNFIMVGILMVSTATLLILGTLTLSGQTDNIARSWHALNLLGSHAAELWIVKVMCLLADFLVAFFSYAMAIRLATHVLFMVNVPKEFQRAHDVLSPEHAARRLNRAGRMVGVGMRAFLFAIPLAFWLFGPLYLFLATAAMIFILSRLDRHHEGF
ncbi:MAG TPA: DUF599 domain-containing protein [Rhodocyclaceae bacterium]|nr:DUF599 domain-containing protein [Rhodocyclaceae bacterium]